MGGLPCPCLPRSVTIDNIELGAVDLTVTRHFARGRDPIPRRGLFCARKQNPAFLPPLSRHNEMPLILSGAPFSCPSAQARVCPAVEFLSAGLFVGLWVLARRLPIAFVYLARLLPCQARGAPPLPRCEAAPSTEAPAGLFLPSALASGTNSAPVLVDCVRRACLPAQPKGAPLCPAQSHPPPDALAGLFCASSPVGNHPAPGTVSTVAR